MPDFFKSEYNQKGTSKKTNDQGMREMQQIAFKANSAQYLLIKAPPASGKSRALMFIALEKLQNQGIKKVIVAVPERNIGASFKATALSKDGFFADWSPNPHYNLCTSGSEKSKVSAFLEFLDSDEKILICTHATFRFACDELDAKQFNDCLIAIDEFHHVSANDDNRLGEVMKNIMAKSNAHIVAMTGSYFRGDNVPVLLPEDEIKFTKVTYNYYQQLNGYEFLKSLGIGYHFYTGRYFKKPFDKDISALAEILDVTKKTIIHIPNVNANESSKDKMAEVIAELAISDQLSIVDSGFNLNNQTIYVFQKAKVKPVDFSESYTYYVARGKMDQILDEAQKIIIKKDPKAKAYIDKNNAEQPAVK